MIGESLSHFNITAKLGEGGMGEVYRAEDTKLGRDVALKLLPPAFAQDADRMARFAREAQVLASLNHANIAAIYGLEEAGDKRALVMELVEGETLAERIARGPLPVEDAARLSLQIANALENAHDRGIVHRDLKPANVKVTPQGEIKVLDFGLAKALEDERPGGDLSHSPTITAAATQAGVLLGTAAYMSPEQAAGSPADRRADVWAFGVVLSEMLTGRSLFRGETVSHVLAGVLKDEPEWTDIPTNVPPALLELLKRCLRKDPRQRLQAIGEARIVLEGYVADPTAFEAASDAEAAAVRPVAGWRRLLPWVVTGAFGIALVGALWSLWPVPAGNPAPTRRSSLQLPDEETLFRGYGSSVALSPDGRRVAYIVAEGNNHRLFVRSLTQWQGTEVLEASGASRPYQPFFSPDGDWIGFVTPSELKRIPVSGGTPIKLTDVSFARGSSWGEDGTIVFTPSPTSPLHRIPASGGESEPITELVEADGETSHRWPQFLPGGEVVIFTSNTTGADFFSARIEALELETGRRKVLHEGGTYGRFVPPGFLTYVNGETLFAVPFDPERLEVAGAPAPVVEEINASGAEGSAQYSVAADGTLVYVQGNGGSARSTMRWVDRNGKASPLWDEPRSFANPRLSPDGTRVAVQVETEGQADIWIFDLERDIPSRLTFDEGNEVSPVWTPDGETIVFASNRAGAFNLYRKAADGSGDVEPVNESPDVEFPFSISSDGRLAFVRFSTGSGGDLWTMPLDGEPEVFLSTPALEVGPAISPDGRWLAYFSNESGQMEVYVRPMEGRGKWQISPEGGAWPVWSRDGKELFYWVGGGPAYASIDTDGGRFRASRSEVLFKGIYADVLQSSSFDVSPDGERFVMFESDTAQSDAGHEHIQVISNWFAELERTFAKPRD